MVEEQQKLECMLLEYRALRDEILQSQKEIGEIMIYSIVGTGAILGYGFGVQVGFIFLIPFALLIPMSHSIRKRNDTILLLGSYISAVIEKNAEGLKWETFLYRLREIESGRKRRLPQQLESIMIYDFLSVTCIVLTFFYWDALLVYFGAIVSPVVIYLIWWNFTFSASYSFKKQRKILIQVEKVAENLKA
jgi:hypothetical protein